MAQRFEDVGQLVDAVIAERGRSLKVGFPLGLGKPNHIANELVDRVLSGELDRLEIFTALSLSRPPAATSDLKHRLMGPVLDRLFAGYPDLKYVQLQALGELPENIVVHEFYMTPGAFLNSATAQRHYKSVNFTDAFREMKEQGLDLIAQMVGPTDDGWDLSCNTDLSKELFPKLLKREDQDRPMLVGQVNRRLPLMGGTAEVGKDVFDAVLDNDEYDYDLFGLPSLPVSDVEYAIGTRVASLLRDGGTIQIGIGGLGTAVSWAAIFRHQDPESFQRLVEDLGVTESERKLIDKWGGLDPFEEGLYACSEMFVEGLLHMADAGVLSREVDGAVLDAAFYLGSPAFYEGLRALSPEMRQRLRMRSVRFTNLLYNGEEEKRGQRVHARFINSAMMVTALGAVVSDGLDDGRVVSGVGGQYEFVAMANALDDGRGIITLPATRERNGEVRSNILWSYGHCTIPRHLRDIVVTEYGIADLRGKSDEEIVAELIGICDSRFQEDLVKSAKASRKLAPDWQIPEIHRRNLPEVLKSTLAPYRRDGTIKRCPFGSSLTEIELDLVEGLQHLKGVIEEVGARQFPQLSGSALMETALGSTRWDDHLDRMGLKDASSMRERLMRSALIYGLNASR